jgi:hypothetical protein
MAGLSPAIFVLLCEMEIVLHAGSDQAWRCSRKSVTLMTHEAFFLFPEA